jgi:hypothetical protein
MIVDIPKGLLVPMVSSPPTSVPEWNSEDKNFLPLVFDFGSSLTHDNGVLLLFHKDDLKLRAAIRGFAKAYHFSIMKEWTGINRLPITSARDVLFNLVTKDTQLMRGSTPWRGGREKDLVLLQLLIESTMQVGDIVFDCIASTGM